MTPVELLTSQALADEFMRLRHDLEARVPAPLHVVVLGMDGGEGTSTVAAQLALAFAVGRDPNDSRAVLLADADLRSARPSGHPLAALAARSAPAPSGGLWHWDLKSLLPATPLAAQPAVHWLPAGPPPADRLGLAPVSARLVAAMERARHDYAVSVWDLPPVRVHGDGLDLAAVADGALVVIEMDETRVDALRYLRQALERRRVTLLGSVLNRCGRWWPPGSRRLGD